MTMDEIVVGDTYRIGNHPVYGPWSVCVVAKGRKGVFVYYYQHGSNEFREAIFDPADLYI